LKKHFVRALDQISTLSLSKLSERRENLAGTAGSDLHVADLRRMLCSSSYVLLLYLHLNLVFPEHCQPAYYLVVNLHIPVELLTVHHLEEFCDELHRPLFCVDS
jgi:hypothetical protein